MASLRRLVQTRLGRRPGNLAATLLAVALAGGCQEELIVTPYVMRRPEAKELYEKLNPALQTAEMPILYVTDRGRALPGEGGPAYTSVRSLQVTYGHAEVVCDPALTWDELVDLSTSGERKRSYAVEVTNVTEVGSFTPLEALRDAQSGSLATSLNGLAIHNAEVAEFDRFLSEALAKTEDKEVILFVHGYNNTFDNALIRLAQAWHFSGRRGVPLVYTWPAGGSGGLSGYGYDRESGEFTVLHLKAVLRAVAMCPEVKGVHIIAHSRGTDVVATALRELNAEVRGLVGRSFVAALLPEAAAPEAIPEETKASMREILKIKTVVLAAPDLDLQVFGQRVVGENILQITERLVVYFSPDDLAISFARWLMGSTRRLGSLSPDDFTAAQRKALAKLPDVEMIDCSVSGYTTSHAYVFQHPSALSDLILLVWDGRNAGAANGRPLQCPEPGVWRMTNAYLNPDAPKEKTGTAP